jgi:hypothetical protein
MPCASDAEFLTKLAYLAEIEFKDYSKPEGQDYESLLCAEGGFGAALFASASLRAAVERSPLRSQ